MRLYVVRHGESVNNAGFTPVPDPPLTPLGLAQADWLGACWRGEAFHGLICSPLWRTLQTAEPLLAAARVGRTVAWPALVEWNRSNPLDGHPPAEIAARFPSVRCDPSLHEVGWPEYPGSETAADVIRRAAGVLERLIAEFPPDARLVVVAHSGFDGAILCAALGADLDRVRFGQGNGRVNTLDYDRGRYTLRSVNSDPSWVAGSGAGDGARQPGPVANRELQPGELDVYLLAGGLAAEAAAEGAARPGVAAWRTGRLDGVVVAHPQEAGQRAAQSLARATAARLAVWPGAPGATRPNAQSRADALWDDAVRAWPQGGAIAVVTPAPLAARVLAVAIGGGSGARPEVLLDEGSLSHVRLQEGRVRVDQVNAALPGAGLARTSAEGQFRRPGGAPA